MEEDHRSTACLMQLRSRLGAEDFFFVPSGVRKTYLRVVSPWVFCQTQQ